MYLLSSYRFICYCFLPSVYLVKGKDIKRYLCFQILCLRFYPRLYNSIQLSNILLRPLRDQRENTRKSTQSIRTEETPMSPADFADSRRQTPKTTLTTNCLSLRNNAACCIPSA